MLTVVARLAVYSHSAPGLGKQRLALPSPGPEPANPREGISQTHLVLQRSPRHTRCDRACVFSVMAWLC